MAKELILQQISDNGPRELGRLKGIRVPMGRELKEGVQVPFEGVSRTHGIFSQAKNHWLYADQSSTNGSWINGERAFPGTWKIVRSGDLVQAGDIMMRLADGENGSKYEGEKYELLLPQSLIVLNNGEIVDEYPVPEAGQALVVGGTRGDLSLEGVASAEPTMVIERRDGQLCLLRYSELPVMLNGEPIGELATLNDNDQIAVQQYLVVVHDPQSRRTRTVPQIQKLPSANVQQSEDAVTSRRRNALFGNDAPMDVESVSSTQVLDPEVLERIQRSYGKNVLTHENPVEVAEKFALLEDSLIMIVGIGLLGALVGILLWWFLKK